MLRYAERQALPPETPVTPDSSSDGFSIVPREEKLRIVGIVETDPAGDRGIGRGRLLIPLQLAENLRAAQANDLRDLCATPRPAHYENLTVRVSDASKVQDVEDAIKQMGFSALFLCSMRRSSLSLVFAVFDLFLGIFGSLALVVASLGIINTLVMAILSVAAKSACSRPWAPRTATFADSFSSKRE